MSDSFDLLKKLQEIERLVNVRAQMESSNNPNVKHKPTKYGTAQGIWGIMPGTAQDMARLRNKRGEADDTDRLILTAKDINEVENLLKDNVPLQERYANEYAKQSQARYPDSLEQQTASWVHGYNKNKRPVVEAIASNKEYLAKLKRNIEDIKARSESPIFDIPDLEVTRLLLKKDDVTPASSKSRFNKIKPIIKDTQDSIMNQFINKLNTLGDNDIKPGDETTLANSPRNQIVEALGLPDNLKQTVAEDKSYRSNLPEQMATTGSVREVGKMPQVIYDMIQNPKSAEEFAKASRLGLAWLRDQARKSEKLMKYQADFDKKAFEDLGNTSKNYIPEGN